MIQIINKQLIPDDREKTGGINSNNDFKKPENPAEKTSDSETPKEEESFIDKVKDALQDWSNDNEKDIEEDDNSALRSGL